MLLTNLSSEESGAICCSSNNMQYAIIMETMYYAYQLLSQSMLLPTVNKFE